MEHDQGCDGRWEGRLVQESIPRNRSGPVLRPGLLAKSRYSCIVWDASGEEELSQVCKSDVLLVVSDSTVKSISAGTKIIELTFRTIVGPRGIVGLIEERNLIIL
jgi:hypothetical protein